MTRECARPYTPLKLLVYSDAWQFLGKTNLMFYIFFPSPRSKKRSRAIGQVEARALVRRPWEHINIFYSAIEKMCFYA